MKDIKMLNIYEQAESQMSANDHSCPVFSLMLKFFFSNQIKFLEETLHYVNLAMTLLTVSATVVL